MLMCAAEEGWPLDAPAQSGEVEHGGFAPRPGDALIVVDVQLDFLPGGALAVAGGDRVIEPLNRLLDHFARHRLPVFATRDWHPRNHCSFAEAGGPWPVHCVAGSAGAAFAASLRLPAGAQIVSKGRSLPRDAYSGFGDTDLGARLSKLGVHRLYIGGLATDYCVRQTVLDARALGFEVVVIADAIAAVNVQPADGERALSEMVAAGAKVVGSAAVLA